MKEQPHFNPRKARADFRGLRGWSFQILWLRFQWTWQNLRIIWRLRVGDGLVPGPEIVFLNKLLVAVLFFKWNFKVGNKLDYLLYWHLKQAPWVAGCFWSFGSLFTLGDFFFFLSCVMYLAGPKETLPSSYVTPDVFSQRTMNHSI